MRYNGSINKVVKKVVKMHLDQKQTFLSVAVGGGRRDFCAAERGAGAALRGSVKVLAFLFLAGVLGQMLFPVIPGKAATDDVEVELELEPTIEMALDKTSLTLYDSSQCETGDTEDECAARGTLPTSTGTQVSATMNVYVTTNAANGYTLKVYTLNPTNEMKHINSGVTADIDPVSAGSVTLSANTWGFKYGSGNWMAVGASESSQTTIIENGEKSSGVCSAILNKTGASAYESCVLAGTAKKNPITFGANVTDALPSGRYTNDVVFSAVAKTANTVGGN